MLFSPFVLCGICIPQYKCRGIMLSIFHNKLLSVLPLHVQKRNFVNLESKFKGEQQTLFIHKCDLELRAVKQLIIIIILIQSMGTVKVKVLFFLKLFKVPFLFQRLYNVFYMSIGCHLLLYMIILCVLYVLSMSYIHIL